MPISLNLRSWTLNRNSGIHAEKMLSAIVLRIVWPFSHSRLRVDRVVMRENISRIFIRAGGFSSLPLSPSERSSISDVSASFTSGCSRGELR